MPLQTLIDHLSVHAIRTDGPFTLRSGEVSDWYLDARQTTFDGGGAWAVGRAVLGHLDPSTEAVGGLTIGADPIAIATAMVATLEGRTLRAFSIRKEAKAHGTGGRLVGPVGPGTLVTMVEDTTTTGGALIEAARAALESGLVIVQAITLVDRSGGATEAGLAEMGIPYTAMLRPADLGFSS